MRRAGRRIEDEPTARATAGSRPRVGLLSWQSLHGIEDRVEAWQLAATARSMGCSMSDGQARDPTRSRGLAVGTWGGPADPKQAVPGKAVRDDAPRRVFFLPSIDWLDPPRRRRGDIDFRLHRINDPDDAPRLTHLQTPRSREHPHHARGGRREPSKPVMLYSIGKDSAVMLHLAHEGLLPGASRRSRCCTSTRRGSSATMYAFRDRMARELGLELLVHINPEGVAQGINPFTHGSAVHTDMMEDRGPEAGARQVRLRRRVRRRAPRRGEVARQGAHLLVPHRPAPLGPEEPAARALAALQRAQAQGRVDARLPAVELDRARHLAVHLPREHPDRAAVLRRASGRSSSATAR